MSEHLPLTEPDTEPHEHDRVDELGRAAGEALRRPAPADGVTRLRTARRRQQVARSVAGGATAVVLALGVFAVTRQDDQLSTSTDTSLPASTVPTSTIPASTVPEPTVLATPVPDDDGSITTLVPTTVAASSDTFDTWIAEQLSAGRVQLSRIEGRGTDASILVADNLDPVTGGLVDGSGTERSTVGAVLLADGRIAPLPDDTVVSSVAALQLVGLGDRIAAVTPTVASVDPQPPALVVLDEATLTWQPGPELGLPAAPGLIVESWSVGGSVLIGRAGWIESDSDSTAVPTPGTDGVVVRPDLTVEPIATPPDGVQASWTSVSGDLALSFGWAGTGSAYVYPSAPNPWAFDVTANEWFAVPNPEWMDCGDCEWFQPVEASTPFLEVGTQRGALVRVPDGSIGLLDTTTLSWRRLDDAPFQPYIPTTALTGNLVVVAPTAGADAGQAGVVGTLDLATGSWTTQRFPIAENLGPQWDVRVSDSEVLVQPQDFAGPAGEIEFEVARVIDASGTWRNVTSDEAAAWLPFATSADLRAVAAG